MHASVRRYRTWGLPVPGGLGDAEDLLEPPPEASAFEMAVGLVGEVHHPQITQISNTGAVVAARHLKAAAVVAVAQRHRAVWLLREGVKSVLHQLLDQMLRRPRGVHGRKTIGADRQPALGVTCHPLHLLRDGTTVCVADRLQWLLPAKDRCRHHR